MAEILFVCTLRHYFQHQSTSKHNLFQDQLIYRAINLLHNDLGADWNIEHLARKVGISRTLFINRFKKAVGMPSITYLTNWRMTKASYFLSQTDWSLVQISEKVGYQSETSFSRAFRKQLGISPGKYRVQQSRKT